MGNSVKLLLPAEGPGWRPAPSPSEGRGVTAGDRLAPARDFLPEARTGGLKEMMVSLYDSVVLKVMCLRHRNRI